MAIIKMHQASDGSLHKSFEEYAAHEERLKITAAVKEAAFVNTGFELDDRDNSVLFRENIGEFIAANADVLRKILSESAVGRRGRKPTSEEKLAA